MDRHPNRICGSDCYDLVYLWRVEALGGDLEKNQQRIGAKNAWGHTMRARLLIVSIIGTSLLFGGVAYAAESPTDFKSSVVKIFASTSDPDFNKPWQSQMRQRAIGSGAVIAGNRILTSAHVVSYATFIEVKKSNSDKRYHAKVEAIGNDCDLALLTVNDDTFFKGVPSLPIGPLPNLQDSVLVIGFPKGGDELSVTKGIVSRIDAVPYSHSMERFMAVQIDAAINPGNSGGPVIQNNQLVGIAFEGLKNADNIGYMVPEPIIINFLDDLKDGKYDGFPRVGIWWNQSANSSLREHYGLKENEGGLVIKYVLPDLKKEDLLRVGDVLLSVDSNPVGSDGTVFFKNNSRLPMGYWFDSKQVGDTIDFEIFRGGKKFKTRLAMRHNDDGVKYKNFYEKPPYFIYGGMVFTTLTENLIEVLKEQKTDINGLIYYVDGPGRFTDQKDVVVLLYALPDEINAGYQDLELEIVKEANGKRITSLADLALSIKDNQGKWNIIRTEDKAELIFDREKAAEAESRILTNYKIISPYSDDLRQMIGGKT